MRISIVVPSFNQARYLDAALRSLVEQEYSDKEIIVMDGGSTDGSVDIIRKYEKHIASWRSTQDGGQADAIATGFGITTGQVIGWLNSDDVLYRGALKRLARAVRLAGSPDGVFYGGYEVIDADSQVQEVFFGTRTVSWIARSIGPVICQPGTFFGRDAYIRVGGVDTSLKYSMDFDLWMRFLSADMPFYSIPEIQGQFRSHHLQKGHSLTWLNHCLKEREVIGRRYGMAPKGSIRYLLALWSQRFIKLLEGRRHETMLFRIMRHRRLRLFTVNYSA